MQTMHLLRIISAVIVFTISASALSVEEGELAPHFNLPSIYPDKPSISLQELAGKTVYIDFWASWCAPCLISLPLYNDMYHRYKDQGLEVLAISVDNPVEEGLEFLEDTPLDFLIPSDPEGETAELFQVIGMPTSYLISPDGEVKLVHMGFRNGDMDIIEAAVKEVLEGN
ncbi:MAG: TlpA disulfide reductase family protein [Pseudomonadota bacterium]|uniref:Thioredoxin domain-containing protein n=1 Tax=marine metagenome TaxID=408172 RepID=A0A382FUW9_9ZZZZ|nr:redoxin [Gammaproteobacteria bacterium]MEC7766795.1 TlpA disulfide reductase family protein [Pseudomonadota bacterium]MEC8951168.1 TlpA disulfide reductase family protein [Pseudomonadota bacterium]MEC8994107.1 TlpA disulfide reductase family protein [Pseudomonadota bacterium]MEC9218028.1 TlpA disulfide reductase family protein [Pseudomonadota bacterium]|tara:strand:+ start:568 stop:1077 length:510 start_codon:yes stop_codon:yes gene_type:complete